MRSARERLARLEMEAQASADVAARRAEFRLVLGKLQEFAGKIQSGLDKAEPATQREVIRALVKQIDIGDEDIRIVYRVPPIPFVERPEDATMNVNRRRA
jgi:site-specific DNA recombinase